MSGGALIAVVIGIAMIFAVSISMAIKAKKDRNAQD